jgi:1-acyl-sn-glycerol-3-phosphate acyltransferase
MVVIAPATIWYAVRIVWAVARRRPDAECVCDQAPREWARVLMRWAGVRVVLENAEVIDTSRPQILVANHNSWFDVLSLTAFIPGRYVFVAKKEL